jgi:hypothetical protein
MNLTAPVLVGTAKTFSLLRGLCVQEGHTNRNQNTKDFLSIMMSTDSFSPEHGIVFPQHAMSEDIACMTEQSILSQDETMDVFRLAESEPAGEYWLHGVMERNTIEGPSIPSTDLIAPANSVDGIEYEHDKVLKDTAAKDSPPKKHDETPVLGLRERFLLFLEKEMRAKYDALEDQQMMARKERNPRLQVHQPSRQNCSASCVCRDTLLVCMHTAHVEAPVDMLWFDPNLRLFACLNVCHSCIACVTCMCAYVYVYACHSCIAG